MSCECTEDSAKPNCPCQSDMPRKNTIDEMIEVCTAAKEGKMLQVRECNNGVVWSDLSARRFAGNFLQCQYRVKKEPRRIFRVYGTTTDNSGELLPWSTSRTREEAEKQLDRAKNQGSYPPYHIVEYVEKL